MTKKVRNRVIGLVGASLVVLVGLVAGTSPTSAEPVNPVDASSLAAKIKTASAAGGYHQILNKQYNQCADVPFGAEVTEHVQLRLFDCYDGGTVQAMTQRWVPVLISGTTYVLVNQFSGLCLGVAGASKVARAAIEQASCLGGTDQQWLRVPAYVNGVLWETFRNVNSGMCLDTVGAQNTGLMQWPCQGNDAQYWDTVPWLLEGTPVF